MMKSYPGHLRFKAGTNDKVLHCFKYTFPMTGFPHFGTVPQSKHRSNVQNARAAKRLPKTAVHSLLKNRPSVAVLAVHAR